MKIFNKRAKLNFKLEGTKFEAGLVLTGAEVKAVKSGHLDLTGATARILCNEAWLINAKIPVAGALNYDPARSRKLLLRRQEIIALETKMKQKKLTLVPLSMYTKGSFVKAQLALGKFKRKFEKKEAIKQKDIQRDTEKEFRGRL